MRPKSMVQFDYAYLGSLAVGLLNTALTWADTTSQVSVQRAMVTIGSWYPAAVVALGFGLSLLLWYLTSRKANVVAMWVLVILTGIGIAITLVTLLSSFAPTLINLLIGVTLILEIAALALLFKPDARAWFATVEPSETVA